MQIFAIVNVPNTTITTFPDNDDMGAMVDGATRDNGSFDQGTFTRIEQARARRRLAAQGAREVRFFPVKEAFPTNH